MRLPWLSCTAAFPHSEPLDGTPTTCLFPINMFLLFFSLSLLSWYTFFSKAHFFSAIDRQIHKQLPSKAVSVSYICILCPLDLHSFPVDINGLGGLRILKSLSQTLIFLEIIFKAPLSRESQPQHCCHWGWVILCCGYCPVHCRKLNSISGIHS